MPSKDPRIPKIGTFLDRVPRLRRGSIHAVSTSADGELSNTGLARVVLLQKAAMSMKRIPCTEKERNRIDVQSNVHVLTAKMPSQTPSKEPNTCVPDNALPRSDLPKLMHRYQSASQSSLRLVVSERLAGDRNECCVTRFACGGSSICNARVRNARTPAGASVGGLNR